MTLTEQQISEARKVYERYWNSYLNGEEEAFASTLDDGYRLIGTSVNEICRSKKEGLAYSKRQGKEVVGNVDRRNRQVEVSSVNGLLLITDFFDLYVRAEKEWMYYSKTRISTLLREGRDGWKVAQQHGSFPDSRVEDDQTLALKAISKENMELRDAVKRRTVELEIKNRELEIESSLERVRTRTMAMQESHELAEVAFVLFEELRSLGGNLWGTGFGLCAEHSDEDEFWFAHEDGVLPPVTAPNTEDPAHKQMYQGWKDGLDHLAVEASGQDLADHYAYMMSLPQTRPFFQEILDKGHTFPEWQQWNAAYFTHGYLLIITLEPYPDPEILPKFARVFDQTYTRFLDLQKAEEQAREAQIEAALEKVRARSMGMQSSEELGDVISLICEKMEGLHIPVGDGVALIIFEEDSKDLNEWMANEGFDSAIHFHLPYFDHPVLSNLWDARERGEHLFFHRYTSEENRSFLNHIFEHSDYRHTPESVKEYSLAADTYATTIAFQKNTAIFINDYSGNTLSDADMGVLERFANVFEQTYTRFLDLQKAEEQAREAKIETALEKIRSRTMGMQNSDELPEVANLLFLEVQGLGINAWSCGYCILEDDGHSSTCIMSSEGSVQKPFLLPHTGEASFEEWDEFVHSEDHYFVQELQGEAIESHYGFMKSLPQLKPILQDLADEGLALPTYQVNHLSKFSHGFLLFITYEEVPDAHDIFKRFTGVFDQTYTRFLDLKKSEQRAREAEVELALERVRAQVTAMQQSSDLFDIVVSMRSEFISLGHQADYFWHMRWLPEAYDMSMTSEDGKRIGMVISIPKHVHAKIPELDAWEKGDEPILALALNAEEAWDYIEHMNEYGRYEQADPDAPSKEDIEALGGLTFIIARTSHGEIGYSLPGEVPDPPKEARRTLTRFAGVFDLAYQRFEDLQEAEQRARETQIELSLERIRAKISAMQEPGDLQDLMVDMRTEFTSLGYEAHYFWYMRWLKDTYEKAMTSGDGSKIGMVMTLPREIHSDIESVVRWEQSDEPYMVLDMDPDTAVDYVNKMITMGDFQQLDPQSPGEEDIRRIGGLTFVMARTSQGEIGYSLPGVVPEPPQEAIDTLLRFARVFDLAYQRFEDLKEAERQAHLIREERDRLEATLNELHATQDQLIQQEKLASLGQLTAGIAHEIKNPLNFVNNFSELNVELIEESREELLAISDALAPKDKEKVDEALEILSDIEMNLRKIHEHGTRADSIVKSMLEHSRGGSGKLALTDLNALLKEFVNLSYHGMRASKNPIDVDLQFDLHEPTVEHPLIAEDFSRVIVNLCNNAFDAMREKQHAPKGSEQPAGYRPKLTIRTEKVNGKVRMEIEDNGPGIPDELRGRILQPFFTTKKGTQGTGLGLSITNDIIKAHGAHLDIRSINGSGAAFCIQFTNQSQGS